METQVEPKMRVDVVLNCKLEKVPSYDEEGNFTGGLHWEFIAEAIEDADRRSEFAERVVVTEADIIQRFIERKAQMFGLDPEEIEFRITQRNLFSEEERAQARSFKRQT